MVFKMERQEKKQTIRRKRKKWKKMVKSPYMILPLLGVKLLTYYYLIDVNILLNPFVLFSVAVFLLLFVGIGRSSLKQKGLLFLALYSFVSIIMFADSMYYNYYNQTVSIKQLWQASNVAKVPNSFIATLIPASFILLFDIPFVYYYFKRDVKIWNKFRKKRTKILEYFFSFIGISILLLSINPFHSEWVKSINSVEFFSNHISDILLAVKDSMPKQEVPEDEVLKVIEKTVEKIEGTKWNGIAKGKNLIVIQLESFQNCLLFADYHGQELTPNLNQLIQKDSIYYNNYYTSIGKGNTVDAEFSSMNSLYPVIDRECYELYTENTYNGLPWILRDEGYQAFAVHGYEASFWNRDKAYPYQGFEEFYSIDKLVQDEQIGLGISDESVFRQTIPILKSQNNPYFAFIITLTNHHPYELNEEKCEITIAPEDEGTKFSRYLQTVYYTDKVIGQFIEQLKTEELYENTVIALYGDHHGLNWTMDGNDQTMGRFLGREYDYDEMMNVPLIIHIPNSGIKETVSTVGGQIDFLPTIANLMGLSIPQPYILGQDLSNAKNGFAAFTAYLFEGSFVKDGVMFEISREGVFNGSRAFEPHTGKELNYEDYYKDYERTIEIKKASKDILEQDLIANYVNRHIEVTEE